MGDKVWLSTADINLKSMNRKLAPRFIGPFVIKVINPVAMELSFPDSLQVHPIFHVSWLKLMHELEEANEEDALPATRIIDGGPVYTVSHILRSRRRGR